MSGLVVRILVVTVLFVSSNAQAQTPQDVAASFLSVAGPGDYETAATFFNEADLKTFRDSIRSMSSNDRYESYVLVSLFGKESSPETVNSLSDAQFFAAFLRLWLEIDDEFSMTIGDFKVIGEVREDNGLVHVLTRHKFHVGDEAFETITVTHVIDSGNSPKIAMPPEIASLPAMFRQTLGR